MPEETPHLCRKCGRPVTPDNSIEGYYAVIHRLWESGETGPFTRHGDRHILPISSDDGKPACPGSPSSLQYIEGYPQDPGYPIQRDQIEVRRQALVIYQQENPPPITSPTA